VFKTGGAIKGPILVHDGAAYFASWDEHLYAVDLERGRARWKLKTGARAMSGAALSPDHGLVFMGSHDQYLYAVE
jgi:outer membrane protein assembly factor BamB